MAKARKVSDGSLWYTLPENEHSALAATVAKFGLPRVLGSLARIQHRTEHPPLKTSTDERVEDLGL